MKSVLLALSLMSLLGIGCAGRKELTMLIRMMPEQEKYFKENIIAPFEKKNRCRVNLVSYAEIEGVAQAIRDNPKKIVLVKTAFEQTQALEGEGLILSIDSAAGPKLTQEIRDEYFLLQLCTYDNKLYFFPRKFETRILVYLKSKVSEAVIGWGADREAISAMLQAYNGVGLPAGYTLEADPNQWDNYDVLVAGYYWAHKDSTRLTPKVAQRGRRYSGTCQTLVDRIYALGGSARNVLSMEGEAVVDMFEWEALVAREGIANPKSWEQGWSGLDIWNGFASGEVYLSYMTQLDCFYLHGNYTKEQPGYVDNPDDLGFAVMPLGVSVELDMNGRYVREGSRAASTGGWWWGIPYDSPNPAISVKLAEWILSSENQVKESAQFGMLPVRKDILGDLGLLYGKNWISEVYNVSLKQMVFNKYTTVPLHARYNDLVQVYLDAWTNIVGMGNYGSDKVGMHRYLKELIASTYKVRAQEILGNAAPLP
jgi:ABC-type glycerol-3-phosphate transport system substrate-binding protein